MGKRSSYKPSRSSVECVSVSKQENVMSKENGSSVATIDNEDGAIGALTDLEGQVESSLPTIDNTTADNDTDVPPEGIVCPSCDNPLEKYGTCPKCLKICRTPRNKRGGVKKIGELESLSNWKFKIDEPISVASFADECSGVSLLHSLFMVQVQLPSMVTYYQRLVDDLAVVGADGIEEYVERKRDLNRTGQAIAKHGAPAVLTELAAACSNKEELKAALAALLATM